MISGVLLELISKVIFMPVRREPGNKKLLGSTFILFTSSRQRPFLLLSYAVVNNKLSILFLSYAAYI